MLQSLATLNYPSNQILAEAKRSADSVSFDRVVNDTLTHAGWALLPVRFADVGQEWPTCILKR